MNLTEFLTQAVYDAIDPQDNPVTLNFTLPDIDGNFVTDAESLWYAHRYAVTETNYIDSNLMNALLAQHSLAAFFEWEKGNLTSPFADACIAFTNAVKQPSNFNFNSATINGAANVNILQAMIDYYGTLGSGAVTELNTTYDVITTRLTAFRNLVTVIGVKTSYPLANSTLVQVMHARNRMTYSTPTISGRFAVIEQNATTDSYDPILWGYNPRTLQWQSINVFRNVDAIGMYEAIIPSECSGWSLRVDNPFNSHTENA
ncbi:hypothetical protein [Bowmanella sp. JS7-9]|uniref:Uncharacterized protein n=1 Tax=Pseudobowmanella zhangzhouensis TaxID=1537679 RepID=A0ABW1XNQ2_9ALTE|nr:hypothetical protein [Bowmanella sp. JS7-9]TBX21927.1 hypothetical protein TK45_10590 [Bowmanella sp. JS7-9]